MTRSADELLGEFLSALTKAWSISQGADVCDRCGMCIWPEIELVRCDFCVGEHGPASQERIKEAYERHKERIRQVEREEREAYNEAE
jgi:hypothetical protein